jgi:adenine-specific DNA-methyltransferase
MTQIELEKVGVSQMAMDLWRAADDTIECANNLDFMSKLDDGTMKLIVTSPPHNIGKTYERRSSLDIYLEMQTQVVAECVRLLHPRGSLCWEVGNHISKDGEVIPLDIVLYPIFKSHGLRLRNRIIWHYEHGLHCSKRFSGRYETILWFTKGADYTFNLDPIRVPSKYPNKKYFKGPKAGMLSGNPLGKNPGDVWIIPNVKFNHIEKTIHPCQFPVELIERLVLSMTDEGDNIFDPYMGVGSSVIAALKNDRNGYGCDIEQRYVDIAKERIRDLHSGRLKTRPMGKPIYDPDLPNGGHRENCQNIFSS